MNDDINPFELAVKLSSLRREISTLQAELTQLRAESLRLVSANDALEKERDGLREERSTALANLAHADDKIEELQKFIKNHVPAGELQAQLSTAQAAEARLRGFLPTINSYLGNGGLFNPELMDHQKVRDLFIQMRAALTTQPTAALPDGGDTALLDWLLAFITQHGGNGIAAMPWTVVDPEEIMEDRIEVVFDRAAIRAAITGAAK